MSQGKLYSREADGIRFKPGGMNTVKAVDQLAENEYAYLQNVRAYLRDRITGRAAYGAAIYTTANPPHTIQRMNSGSGSFVRIWGAAGYVFVNGTQVASGLSSNPISMVSLEPNQSVAPWMYVGDSSQAVTLDYPGSGVAVPTLTASSVTGWVNPSNALSQTAYATCPGFVTNFLSINVPALSLPAGAVVTNVAISGQVFNASTPGGIEIFTIPGSINPFAPVLTVPAAFNLGGPPVSFWGITNAQVVAGFQFVINPDNASIQTVSVNNVVVTISYTYAGTIATTGMLKIRSDGLVRKTGIKEPQVAPVVGINTISVTDWLTLPADTPPWTNIGGVNAAYNYGGTDAQPPYPTTIATPVAGSTVTLGVTGTATVNGTAGTTPSAAQPSGSAYPGHFVTLPMVTIVAGGTGYSVGNVLTITQAGASGGQVTVTSVSSGAVTGISFTAAGT